MTHNTTGKHLRLAFLFVGLLMIAFSASGQTRIPSPYSMFGLGELRFNQNFSNLGMGGLGVGFRSNLSVNEVNPAAYTAIDTLSFVFEATAFSHFYRQSTETQSQTGNYSSLGSLSFGFPVTKWLAVGAGLKPFSSVGYKIHDFDEDPVVGVMNYQYEGEGGINQAFFGGALRPVKGLSVGLNASYLFGRFENHTSVYSDSTGIFLTNRVVSNQVNGWIFGMGAQYEFRPTETSSYTLGITYGSETPVSASRNELVRRMLPGETRFDTIRVENEIQGDLVLPAYWGAGLYARFNPQWAGGIDFQTQNWSDFRLFDASDELTNSYHFALGLQHNPRVQTFSNMFHRLTYRAGFRYGQTYLNPNNHALSEFGISFGLGIPLRRSLSSLRVGFEYAQRGTTDQNLIKEDFFRINIGINIYEHWFLRRRFF
jgi:hypothetical protein